MEGNLESARDRAKLSRSQRFGNDAIDSVN